MPKLTVELSGDEALRALVDYLARKGLVPDGEYRQVTWSYIRMPSESESRTKITLETWSYNRIASESEGRIRITFEPKEQR